MRRHLVTLLSALLIIATPLACTMPPSSLPQALPSAPSPTGTDIVLLPTTQPAEMPTVTPLPPLPPKLVERSPARGEEQGLDKPIVLRFDQEMERDTVEQAWKIDPAVPGTLTWRDGRTFVFQPAGEGFRRATTYRVTLAPSAQSTAGVQLSEGVQFSFETVGYLEVGQVFPEPETKDVPGETVIRVAFTRPVVPLTDIEAQRDLPQPLVFSPPVEGVGIWVNTSIYTFQPSKALAAGTRYTVRVIAGLASVSGAVLPEDYVWSFTTRLPDVVSAWPGPDSQRISPYASVRVVFNQPMQAASVESRFSLVNSRTLEPVPGPFSWQENTMIFTPSQPLTRGETYRAQLAKGALSESGGAAIASTYVWQFTVASLPRVIGIKPRDGQTMVDPGEGLEITFSSPISRVAFVEGLSISPEVRYYTYWRSDDTIVHINTFLAPSTQYTVTIGKGILGRYGEPLQGAPTVIRFSTRPHEPMVDLAVPDRVGSYNAYATPTIHIRYRNVSRVDVALYRLSEAEFVSFHTEEGWRLWDDYAPSPEQLVHRWKLSATAPINSIGSTALALEPVEGKALPSGFYFLEATAPETTWPQRHILIVSPMNLTLKASQKQALIWATDLREGVPLADVRLTVYDGQGNRILETHSDDEGIGMGSLPEMEPWSPLIVIAQHGDQMGAVMRYWSRGISPWEFGLRSEFYTDKYRAHLYTERGIYRPGQTIYFKGILRVDDDATYSLPPRDLVVKASALDSQGREFWRATLPLSEMGTVHGSIALAEDAPLGAYVLSLQVEEQILNAEFQVAEYRKPEFQVQVATDRVDYVQGESIQVTAEASYFFGGPVADSQVRWRLMRLPYTFDRYQGEGYYSFYDYEYNSFRPLIMPLGEVIAEGQGHTDDQGRFTFTLPAEIGKGHQSQRFTVEISIVDINNQEVSARTACIVHQGSFYIGLASDRYVGVAGKEVPIKTLTVNTLGQPRAREAVTVILNRHEWYSVKEEADDGRFYWVNKVKDTPLMTRTATTDQSGIAVLSFVPPEGGSYKILALGKDEFGNEVRSALYLWVSGSGYINWGQRNDDRIALVADKKMYRPGETAQILVPSPYAGTATGLVTIERGGILEYRVISLQSNSEQIQVPILPSYAPNVYVSVVLVHGGDGIEVLPSFKVGYVMLSVSTEQQEIAVTIKPEKTRYQPRDEVTYTIETRDYRGEGVSAEVSLQLVDLAVESLVGGQPPDIVESFYRERGLAIATATTLAVSVDRHNLEYAQEGKGGGGGGVEGLVRQFFPDTAYWAPAVRTDAEGKAIVSVTLPDNLTTWRMTAQAVTSATQVGRGHADIVSTLDVMIRPIMPRFLVIGDAPILGAVVHNNTARDLEMTVALEAEGLQVTHPTQMIKVPARGRATVSWPTEVQPAEEAILHLSVTTINYSDRLLLRLPVYHVSTPEVVGTAGEVRDRVIEMIRLPEALDPTLGELTVELEPSLAAGMREGLRFLESYPYDCIEQTVSRFLPNVFTYRTLRILGIEDPELAAALPRQLSEALQRLYSLQNLDGGWGWWQRDDSSPILTSYVLLGLDQVRDAEQPISLDVIERAVDYLYRWLNNNTARTKVHLDTRAMVLYALAEAERGDLGRSVTLFEDRQGLSLYAKALLAMTLAQLDPAETSRPRTLLAELQDAAILSATMAHWEEQDSTHWAMNTDLRTTAIVLRALVRIAPENTLVPNTVRWLMNARRSGRWETTQENVWSILALSDFMAATGELAAQYDYAVTLNGVERAQGGISTDNLEEPIAISTPIRELLREVDNILVMQRNPSAAEAGTGKLYYTAFLRYFLPADRVRALDRGITVERQYYRLDDPDVPISGAAVNDTVVVKLTIVAPNDLHYLVVEDPLPAGCEAIDTSLATTRSELPPQFQRQKEAWSAYWGNWYRNWPHHTELRDEKVALFASYLRRGTYEYTYLVRCTIPGQFKVMPAMAYEMYAADVFGRSAGTSFHIAAGD